MKKLVVILFLFFNLSIVSVLGNNDNLDLTNEEIEFINSNASIKAGIDPAFIPYEFIDEKGILSGIGPDYLKIVERKSGLKFEIMYGLNWQETYQKAIDGEILVLPTVSKTSEREEYFNFSDSYYEFTRVIVVSQSNKTIKDFDDLKNLTVAVQENSSHHSFLMNYPDINLILYKTADSAISQVAAGNEIAFLASLATVSHIITTKGYSNLRLIAYESLGKTGIHYAVNKDQTVLLSIINKALKSISIEEKNSIHQKWITYEVETPISPWINILIIIILLILIVFIVSLFWNLRLRKEIEKKKIIQFKLENANNVKQQFLARMSHELRTPIHAIRGMSYLLRNSGLDIKQNMYSERISQASSVMLNIVDDILDYSKFTSGKVEFEQESFNLDDVITKVIGIIALKISEKGIKFVYKQDTTIANSLIGDQHRLEQILINLLNNAVKFCNDTSVKFEIENLMTDNNIQELKFTISDTGIGMTEQQVQSLFTPFIQADSSISRRFGGTGLGLSIVKELVIMMGGSISVKSELDVGTSFIVTLKFTIDIKKEEDLQEKILKIKKQHYKALIIGDGILENKILIDYLRAVNIDVHLISGIDFVETNILNKENFNIIIIDYETIRFVYAKIKNIVKQLIMENNEVRTMLIVPLIYQEVYDDLEKSLIHCGITKPVIPSLLYETINDLWSGKNNIPLIKDVSQLRTDIKVAILVVDDNFSNQIIANTILRNAGYNVFVAGDGETAINLAEKYHDVIKIVLMDIHMPIMDGYETTKEIKKLGYDFEIIAMTADIIPGVISKCKEHGMNYYLSKPFEPEKLVSLINQINSEYFESITKDNNSIDYILGLKYMGGDKMLYKKVLEQFYEENNNNISIAKDFLHNKRYNEVNDLIHKMKSGTGSIGATTLFNICNNFQEALKSEKIVDIKKIADIFYLELEIVLKSINKLTNLKSL